MTNRILPGNSGDTPDSHPKNTENAKARFAVIFTGKASPSWNNATWSTYRAFLADTSYFSHGKRLIFVEK